MDVSGIATPFTPNTSTGPQQSRLGKDEFLKLLMTQLGNQDPLSPMDNQAFVTQLAQFAQVEMAQQTSQQLDALLMASASANQLQAASLVGKQATFKADTVEWKPGHVKGETSTVPITGEVRANAKELTITITDSAGAVVRREVLRDVPAGPFTWQWNGLDDSGSEARAGTYNVSVTAAGDDGKNVPAQSWSRSRITGVSFESGYAELILANNTRIKLADVLGVAEGA